MAYSVKYITKQFGFDFDFSPYKNGHINDTYISNSTPRYILQRINHNIFKKPNELMSNVVNVTEFIKKKLSYSGANPDRETLSVIKTVDGKNFLRTDDGKYFRMYKYIENSINYEHVENCEQFYEVAKAFGRFQNMLSDFPATTLYETIPFFHDTKKRFEDFKNAVSNDVAKRKASVQSEIDFAFQRESDTSVIVDAISQKSVPVRVTHNDTKLNNVLLDENSKKAICVIDLDTVMPGSLLYDFGDALRFGASTGAEDETDLSKISFDLNLFEAFTKGFLEEVGDKLTPKEIELLPFSVKLMTFESAIRFLGDYLNGDTYFKIHREHHNLDRARTQIKLVTDIETKLDKMKQIVDKYI